MIQQKSDQLNKNNFDLLRLLFAGTVGLTHVYRLSGFPQLSWISDYLSSIVAVKSFFVISGFLIFMSFERSSSLASYFSKRIRRIYPAYVTIVMLCAIGLLAITSESVGKYFSYVWLKYVAANLVFLNFIQPTLPGVFTSNKMPEVNGALWTLKIEAMFYIVVPLIVVMSRRFSRFAMIVLIYCLSVTYTAIMTKLYQSTGLEIYRELGRQLPGQLSYFMAGAFFYYFLSLFEKYVAYFMVAALSVLIINKFYPLAIIEPFALATVVVFFGLFLHVGNFSKYGDFSYGFYILHFPIIQILLYFGLLRGSPWCFLAAVIVITLGCAIAMWHLVEKRFLLRNSHYVATNMSSDKDSKQPVSA